MNFTLVDTDVVSFLFKGHSAAYLYVPELRDRTPVISFMTLAELDRWVIQSRWGEARLQRFRQYMEGYILVPYSREMCRKWAEITLAAEAVGRRIECADAWVTATALHYNLPLITHNRADFLGVPGLTVISHG
jgi:tRNA(fMet)-specific endonuclease VapC